MNQATLHFFPEGATAGRRLARALGIDARPVALHRFPDGESLVTVAETGSIALLFRSLDDPNARLVEVLLAASALRDRGARRLILIAPYLSYMRQDMAFAPGQAVSQRILGRIMAREIDGLVTVAPHLHRVATLAEVFPGIAALAVDPGPALGRALSDDGWGAADLVIGPDIESEPIAASVARTVGAPVAVARKVRSGDRDVAVALPDVDLRGKRVALVDDMVSTGRTLAECAQLVRAAGASRIEALACHALPNGELAATLSAGGVDRLRSCDSVPHPSNAVHLATLLAAAVTELTA